MEQEQNQRQMRVFYKANFSLYLIFLQKGWVAYPKVFKIQNIIFPVSRYVSYRSKTKNNCHIVSGDEDDSPTSHTREQTLSSYGRDNVSTEKMLTCNFC